MPDKKPDPSDPAQLRRKALSRWENEGRARVGRPQAESSPGEFSTVPDLTNAELVQLQIRVIALENLIIALLAESLDRHRALAREMAAHISPRPGFTPHRLTLHAAA